MVNHVGTPKHLVEFLHHFDKLEDPRQQAKLIYPLEEVLLLTLCAVLSGADGWVEVSTFGKKKLAFLRRFLPFENATPSHDQLGIIFAALDAKRFQQCFIDWASELKQAISGVVAIDGKTLRRSFDRAGSKGPIHMISAWSSQQRLVLGQRQVNAKSNEITAIPELLDLLEVKGAIVTIDAMGCQRKIAAKIITKGADYILGLKGNQARLHGHVESFFRVQGEQNYADTTISCHETVETSHGRIERRKYTVCCDIEWLRKRHDWLGLNSIVMVEYSAETAGKTKHETRYYISSLTVDAKTMAAAIRQHWGIENGLHWVMDMVFRDDECRIRKKNAPANFACVKHMASNFLRAAKGKESMRLKRHMAAWDEEFLYDVITG